METNFLIRTKDLHKTYDNGKIKVNALNGVSLNIEEGDFVAIAGPSGSGKTTFLNLISGLDYISKGDIFLLNKNIRTLKGKNLSDFRRDNIGFIFQAYNLIPVLTVKENIEYVMLLQGVNEKERAERVTKILNQLGLNGMQNRRPNELSGGQQQRVAIARAMVSKPKIILADEPTANLDSKTSNELLDMMENLNKIQGMTFLFSTHDQKIMDRAHRLIWFNDGKVELDKR